MFVPSLVYYLLLGVYLPLVSLGFVFNVTLLVVIISTKKLRGDPRNTFIVALAFSGRTKFTNLSFNSWALWRVSPNVA
jgi:hypothetical protein